MKQKNHLLIKTAFLFCLLFSITVLLEAQVPRTISFQGLLTNPDGSNLPDGTVSLDFMLYEGETGGTAIWTETQSVNVKNGIFSAILGKITPLTAAFDKPYWVGIKVNGNSELVPRIALTASPYSLGGSATVVEPQSGQNFQIKDSTGTATHILNSNGNSWSAGVGKFENGLVVGDTTVVPDTSHLSMKNTNKIKFGINKTMGTLGTTAGGRIGKGLGLISGIFGWGKGAYLGVVGESELSQGVFGISISGSAVHGTSISGSGLNGTSVSGDGISARSSTGFAGHFESGDVWIENKLKIDNVPGTTETNYLIWSSDHFVKVNTTPPTGGTFDGVLHNTPLIIKGPGPNPTDAITLNSDGTANITGRVTIENGLRFVDNGTGDIGDITVSVVGVDIISNNKPVAHFGSTETKIDVPVTISGTSGQVTLDATGNDAINITNSNNTSTWKVDKNGNTTQAGLGTFNTGLKIIIPGGGDISVNATGSDAINVTNSSNTSVWKVNKDGTSTQTGKTTLLDGMKLQGDVGSEGVSIYGNFNTPINVTDANNTSVWKVNKDGTSTQTGEASLPAGWSMPLNNGNTAELSPVDGWHIKDAAGNFLTHNDPNGNALYAGSVSVDGDLIVTGTLYKGAGSFRIDHPLDPLNKYLSHSFVESPDMMNVYNGNILLDGSGEATIELPDWFDALNKDFRYQLTAIGAPGPNLYVSQKVKNNTFKIAGGKTGMEVSWQVTGIRQDPYANLHRIKVEEEKPIDERGKYLHPDAYNQTVVSKQK